MSSLLVLTCIIDPNHGPMDDVIVNRVFALLEKANTDIMNFKWLSQEKACDIFIQNMTLARLSEVAKDVAKKLPLDFSCQMANHHRRKSLLVSDMDSTMIEQECIDELAEKCGIKAHIASITEQAMRGEIDFESSLKARVKLLKDLQSSVLDDVIAHAITISQGAETLVKVMRFYGAKTILVSGGFTFFAKKIAQKIGFDESHANQLCIKDHQLTGEVMLPILDATVKRRLLKEYVSNMHIDRAMTLAVGDGANDVPMLKEAGLGVAFYAKPAVEMACNAQINRTDLTSLLYFQGYNDADIQAAL